MAEFFFAFIIEFTAKLKEGSIDHFKNRGLIAFEEEFNGAFNVCIGVEHAQVLSLILFQSLQFPLLILLFLSEEANLLHGVGIFQSEADIIDGNEDITGVDVSLLLHVTHHCLFRKLLLVPFKHFSILPFTDIVDDFSHKFIYSASTNTPNNLSCLLKAISLLALIHPLQYPFNTIS